jgi:hypothetical protein
MNYCAIDIDLYDLTAHFHVNGNENNDVFDENSDDEYYDAPLCQAHVTCCLSHEKKNKKKKTLIRTLTIKRKVKPTNVQIQTLKITQMIKNMHIQNQTLKMTTMRNKHNQKAQRQIGIG